MSDADEIRNLHQRYARGADERDIAALDSVFTDDAVIDGTRGVQTKAEWLEAMAAPRAATASMHLFADPLLDIDGDRATSDVYAVVFQTGEDSQLTLGMRYVDELVRHDGGWRVHARRARMVWMR